MESLTDQAVPSPAAAPASPARPVRRLGLNHFAFFRAFLEGLPFDEIAGRYLETGTDRRAARTTLRWIVDELTAAARRQRPEVARVARLLRIAPQRLDPPAAAPAMTLETFRIQHDPDNFYTERELLELFELEIQAGIAPAVRRQAARNARLRARQIEAVRWLEGFIAETPAAGDSLLAWLDPVIADRLAQGGIHTVGELVATINTRGRRWWTKIPRLAEVGAGRLMTWLEMNRVAIGAGVEAGALAPFKERLPALKASRPLAFGIVPLEYLEVPYALQGASGINRGPDRTKLAAQNDLAAINAWFMSRKQKPHTLRSYRVHVERFYLWALIERGKALSDLTTEDCTAFRDFLHVLNPATGRAWAGRLPRDAWVGKRAAPRWSPDWRPFAGPLSIDTQNLTRTICASMCKWLCGKSHLNSNPWDGVAEIGTGKNRIQIERSLTREQWQKVVDHLEEQPRDERYYRLRFTLWLAVTGGLRLSEMAAAQLGAIQAGPRDVELGPTWELVVIGKGDKRREVPLPPIVMDALHDYLRARGIDVPRGSAWPGSLPLIATLNRGAQRAAPAGEPLSESALYGMLKRFFEAVATAVADDDWVDADRLRQASTHWLRHTFGTLAADSGADLRDLMLILGHSSITTTGIYVTTGRKQRQRTVQAFAQKLVGEGREQGAECG